MDWLTNLFGGGGDGAAGADAGGGFWSSVGSFFGDMFGGGAQPSGTAAPIDQATGVDAAADTSDTPLAGEQTLVTQDVAAGGDSEWKDRINEIMGSIQGRNAVGSLGKTLVYGLGIEDTAFGQGGLAGGDQVQQGGMGTFGVEALVAGVTGWIQGGSNLKRQEKERDMMMMQYMDDLDRMKDAQAYREGLQSAVIANTGVRAGTGTAALQRREMTKEHETQRRQFQYAAAQSIDTHKKAAR